MIFKLLILPWFFFTSAWCGHPKIPPTVGKPWPLPQLEQPGDGHLKINPNDFSFSLAKGSKNCTLLLKSFERYQSILFPFKHSIQKFKQPLRKQSNMINHLEVFLSNECEYSPHLHMDEMYELKICPPDSMMKATLVSASIWGVLRGLETFSQIIFFDEEGHYRVNCTQILDFPRYSHRGLMLDTSRHYLPIQIIKTNLDLMAMNKFNVFHWHIVDDQSFPYVSEMFPNLSAEGAWSNQHIYSKENINEILEYARTLGIRVIVEFDTPGHTLSWSGQSGLLTECYNETTGQKLGTYGPIDPSNEENYVFLKNLLSEVSETFPDHYLHLGGDEVSFSCWKSNPGINDFMASNGFSSYVQLEEYYITRLINITSHLPKMRGYIVWQEVFDNGVKLDSDTVVHVWKNENNPEKWSNELNKVTSSGFHVILSSCWYLNYISYGVDWHKYYNCDPEAFNGTEAQKKLVVGGEACMWGEYVDETNLIARTWPRAAAVAERLWSSPEKTMDAHLAAPRLEEHRCRLLERGYKVAPLGPSYCQNIV